MNSKLFYALFTVNFLSVLARTIIESSFNHVLEKSLPVAKCRVDCMNTFLQYGSTTKCRGKENPDCAMCWFYCEMLQYDDTKRPIMCSDEVVCFEGCKRACNFYEESFSTLNSNEADVPSSASASQVMIFPTAVLSSEDHGARHHASITDSVHWLPSNPIQMSSNFKQRNSGHRMVYVVFAQFNSGSLDTWFDIEQTEDEILSIRKTLLDKIKTFIVIGVWNDKSLPEKLNEPRDSKRKQQKSKDVLKSTLPAATSSSFVTSPTSFTN